MTLPAYVELIQYAVINARHKPGAGMLVLSSCNAAQDDAELDDDERRVLYAHALNAFAVIHEYVSVETEGLPMKVPS